MKFDKYMIVYEKSQTRLDNYEEAKSNIKELQKFPAADTINEFYKYEKLALKKNYATTEYTQSGICQKHKGKLGCNVSHQMLWDHFSKNSDNEWLLVLEDDAKVDTYDSDERFYKILQRATDYSSNFVQLYTNPGFVIAQAKRKCFGGSLYKMFPQWHTIAYAITRKGIKWLKNNYPMDENIDIYLSNHIKLLHASCWLNTVFLNAGDQPKTKPIYRKGKEIWLRRDSDEDTLGSIIWDS